MLADALPVTLDVPLVLGDVILLFLQRGREVVERDETLLVVLVGVNLLLRLPGGGELVDRLLGLGERARLQALQLLHFLGERLDLTDLVLLLRDQAGHRLLVDVNLVHLVANDRVVLGADDVRVGIEHAPRGIDLAGQQVADCFNPSANCAEHNLSFGLLGCGG